MSDPREYRRDGAPSSTLPPEPRRRRLRVLVLIDRPSATGGAERVAVSLLTRIDPERFARFLCATRPAAGRPMLEEELRAAGIDVLWLNRRSKAHLWSWRKLLAFLRRERIDILHTHKFGSNVWGVLIGRLVGVPVIVAHEHSWAYEGQPLRRFLDRQLIARGASVILAVSPEDRRRMLEIERIRPDRVRLFPNGIPDLPPPSGRDVRAELGIAAGAPVVGTAAGLRPEKALHLLVEAAAVLVKDFPGLRVLIAGRGPEEARLRALIRDRGLDGTVLMLGLRSDIPDVLSALDVAVCCSEREGSPLSVMEYMAAGKPVVASRVGGIPELIEDGTHGLLVQPADAGALAAAIGSLLADPRRRAEMGARARERQRLHFRLDAALDRLAELYESLYSQTRRARDEERAASGANT